jgi:REP element-mobilizing transposase RayT
VTRPRRIVPGLTYLVTRRCTQRKFLMLPDSVVNQVVRYCAALAQRATGVRIHIIVVLSNHYHLIVSDPEGRLPDFMYIFDKFVAKCLNAHRGRWENFFAGGVQASYVALRDEDAIFDKAAYAITNPVTAGLVRRHQEWPGVILCQPGSYRCRRPKVFFREHGPTPKALKLELAPLPIAGLARHTLERLGAIVQTREAQVRKAFRAEGRRFLGRANVLRQDPFASPRSAEPRRRLSPRVATRDKWRRIESLLRLKSFESEYRDARLAFEQGDREVVFPVGTYLLRRRFQVRCADT